MRKSTQLRVKQATPTAYPEMRVWDQRFGWITREEYLVSIPIEELCEDQNYIRRRMEESKRLAAGETAAETERLTKARAASAKGRKTTLEMESVLAAEGFGASTQLAAARKAVKRRQKIADAGQGDLLGAA